MQLLVTLTFWQLAAGPTAPFRLNTQLPQHVVIYTWKCHNCISAAARDGKLGISSWLLGMPEVPNMHILSHDPWQLGVSCLTACTSQHRWTSSSHRPVVASKSANVKHLTMHLANYAAQRPGWDWWKFRPSIRPALMTAFGSWLSAQNTFLSPEQLS